MKKKIWKYELMTPKLQDIHMPLEAEILSLQVQDGIPCIWVLVGNSENYQNRRIGVIGTGFDESYGFFNHHIGTVQLGDKVYHVFDLGYI